MSCGSLPPLPGLIPISALRKSPSFNNNSNNDIRECTPCATIKKEVMGEQRSRRIISQPTVELIDIVKRSRVCTTTPQAPPSGKARAERHRKSDRRRGEHRGDKKRSTTKREKSQSEEESCVNPRVNPIFVWVRQENTHIVDVKCEDYDKRNRIVLTKTAQGWRAIPRTETLVPNLKAAANGEHQSRKIKKNHRVKRKSAAVQVDEEVQEESQVTEPPAWNVPINIESHLPSHTIPIHRKRSLSPEEDNCSTITDDANVNVNTSADQNYDAQASSIECSANKICDVSPLDNLLAVAELEFNQQIQTEAWCEASELKMCDDNSKDFDVSMDSKNDECNNLFSQSNSIPIITPNETFDSEDEKDCDYNEDDENNIAMNDILTRLEQSLQSPDVLCSDVSDNVAISNNLRVEEQAEEEGDESKERQKETEQVFHESFFSDDNANFETVGTEQDDLEVITENKVEPPSSTTLTEPQDDTPTDLSTAKTVTNDLTTSLTISVSDDDLVPTDLSLPKKQTSSISPRPSSRCSETIQSPQPSGLPAVPYSPDVQSKSAFLESLLSTTSQKMGLGSDIVVSKQKEPLDFGKCRKSASPTVTCSEEINSSINCFKRFEEGEPEAKKMKLDDVHLRTMLDANTALSRDNSKHHPKAKSQETSRLLELLTSTESELDAVAQLKQLQSDFTLNLPDPMLVPKDRLSQILMSPGKEIPRLLAQRPELRLPEALAFPHLLQDPDILVITIAQLETIIKKQSVSVPSEKVKPPCNAKKDNSDSKEKVKVREPTKTNQAMSKEGLNRMNELCNDVNLTNSNALNQMMWLPYLHQLEVAAMAFGNGADFLKMLSSAFPPYANQVPDITQMFPLNRYPQQGFPIQSNPFEFPMWPESASHLRGGNQFERSKNVCRDYMEKIPFANGSKTQSTSSHKYLSNKSHHVAPSMYQPNNSAMHNLQHSFMNVVPPAAYQTHNIRPNLHIPQFNSMLSQKSSSFNKNNDKVTSQATNNCDFKSNYYRTPTNANQKYSYNQKLGSLANNHKSKVTNTDLTKNVATSSSHDNYNKKMSAELLVTQPMDLSGSNPCKVRPGKNFYGSDNFNKSSLKLDGVPEVGSTTVNIEDMASHLQDSQKHLWHPLFGNQKSSANPWNWTSVSATGE